MNSEDLNVGSSVEFLWWLKAVRQTVAVPQGRTWPPSSLATVVEPNQKKKNVAST